MIAQDAAAAALPGLMMETPLLIGSLIDHAVRFHGDREIVTHRSGQPDHRYTYRDARRRSANVAHALRTRLGIVPGDRIATVAWNSYRHFELYFGVSGIGAVLHTVNPRLFAQQLEYIVNHAADRYVFVDADLVPILEALAPRLPKVEGYVVLTEAASMPATSLPNAIAYESLLDGCRARSNGRRWTSGARRRCATPRGRPEIRRACCTRTARRCCTRSRPPWR